MIFAFLLSSSDLFSNFSLSVKQDDKYQFNNIIAYNPPYIYTFVKATKDGNPVKLNKNNILIFEAGFVLQLSDIEDSDDGWQKISWTSRITSNRGAFDYSANIFAHYDGEFDEVPSRGKIERGAGLIVVNDESNPIREINFGRYPPGNKIPVQVLIYGDIQVPDFNTNPLRFSQLPLQIDSIKTDTEAFSFEWLGLLSDPNPQNIPTKIQPNFRYAINVFFEPREEVFYSDELRIYFHGGMVTKIPLTGNTYQLNYENQLKLIQPNGGEIFAPCEYTLIKWEGHSPDLPVTIELSTNNGGTWLGVATVKGSEYNWRVPSIATENAKIRVRQDFDRTERQLLREDQYAFTQVNFSQDGNYLLAVNNRGRFLNWDLYSQPEPFIADRGYLVSDADYPNRQFFTFGNGYINDNNTFVFGFRNPDKSQFVVAFTEKGEDYPDFELPLPNNFDAKALHIDRNQQYIVVTAEKNNKVIVISAETREIVRTLTYDFPVVHFQFNSAMDEAYVSLLNAEFLVLNYPDFSVKESYDFSELPLPREINVSPNAKLLGISTDYVMYDVNRTNYLVELDTKRSVGIYRQSGSQTVGMGFSGSSTAFWIGSQFIEQIKLYDLANPARQYTLEGHNGRMSALKVSPNATAMVTTAEANENMYYRTFSSPEADISNAVFSIRYAKINLNAYNTGSEYLGNPSKQTITICNTEESPLEAKSISFTLSVHFKLDEILEDVVIMPGDCYDVDITYMPLDTGNLKDTLRLIVCDYQLNIEVTGIGLQRNISYINNNIDFGEVCLYNEERTGDILLFRNEDPVPLKILSAYMEDFAGNYYFIETQLDTILAPGESFKINLAFIPTEIRDYFTKIIVYHSYQYKHIFSVNVTGKGIGTFADVCHNPLMFIPEIPVREIEVINTGQTDFVIEQFIIDREDLYEVITPTPVLVSANSNAVISIRAKIAYADKAELQIVGNPCVVSTKIELLSLSGTANLSIPEITVNPLDSVRIPILYNLTTNENYKGIMEFEAEIAVNPRLFFPVRIESNIGSAEITSSQVIDGKRYIRFTTDADFSTTGTIAEIIGLPGLAEVNNTNIEFTNNLRYWSEAITVQTQNGKLIVDDDCDDRFILRETGAIQIISLSPVPASDFIVVEYISDFTGLCHLATFNANGEKIMSTGELTSSEGKNTVTLNVSILPPGTYSLQLTQNGYSTSSAFIITR